MLGNEISNLVQLKYNPRVSFKDFYSLVTIQDLYLFSQNILQKI